LNVARISGKHERRGDVGPGKAGEAQGKLHALGIQRIASIHGEPSLGAGAACEQELDFVRGESGD
jgi:hypothetical protein